MYFGRKHKLIYVFNFTNLCILPQMKSVISISSLFILRY